MNYETAFLFEINKDYFFLEQHFLLSFLDMSQVFASDLDFSLLVVFAAVSFLAAGLVS